MRLTQTNAGLWHCPSYQRDVPLQAVSELVAGSAVTLTRFSKFGFLPPLVAALVLPAPLPLVTSLSCSLCRNHYPWVERPKPEPKLELVPPKMETPIP
jgi:hypothetical protein